MGGYTTLSTTGIQGFSGICLAPDGSGFIAASDRGGVYKVSFSGEAATLYVETAGFGLDCEGVTVDPATGDVYFVLEREKQEVRRVRAPEYSESEVLAVITEVSSSSNSGLEAITWMITDVSDLCYDSVRNALWIADSETKTINLCDLQGNVQKIYSVPFIDNGEGLYVDRERQCIWVSDDTTSNIYKISFSNL